MTSSQTNILTILFVFPFFLSAPVQAKGLENPSILAGTLSANSLITEENFVVRAVNGKLEKPLDFTMPDWASSFQIDVLGSPVGEYIVTELVSKPGTSNEKFLVTKDLSKIEKIKKMPPDIIAKIKTDLGDSFDPILTGPYLSLVQSTVGYFNGSVGLSVAPNAAIEKISSGKYQIQIAAYGDLGPHHVQIRITYKKNLPNKKWAVLPVQVFFSGARNWDANSPEFLEFIRRINKMLESAYIQIEIDASKNIHDGLIVNDDSQILKLVSKSLPSTRPALKLYLNEKTYLPQFQISGISLALPGPVPSGKFKNSGVLVAIGTNMTASIADAAKFGAHEILHYLGLSHTYELNNCLEDPYTDTPSSGFANIMAPIPSRAEEFPALTTMQIEQIRRHPLIQLPAAKKKVP